jgi:hypothetical protein
MVHRYYQEDNRNIQTRERHCQRQRERQRGKNSMPSTLSQQLSEPTADCLKARPDHALVYQNVKRSLARVDREGQKKRERERETVRS